MSIIHRTTLTPTKLELLASWLPSQPWYLGSGRTPQLAMAGGFRLDDPAGAVGAEFAIVTDTAGGRARTYLTPLTYRGAPLANAEHALIGTAEHGVLGARWVYDGTRDPVLITQLFALLVGEVRAQAQSTTDTPDPSVTSRFAESGQTSAIRCVGAHDVPGGTDLLLESAAGRTRRLIMQVHRSLPPDPDHPAQLRSGRLGEVIGEWRQPDGATAHGPFAVVHDAASTPPATPR